MGPMQTWIATIRARFTPAWRTCRQGIALRLRMVQQWPLAVRLALVVVVLFTSAGSVALGIHLLSRPQTNAYTGTPNRGSGVANSSKPSKGTAKPLPTKPGHRQ